MRIATLGDIHSNHFALEACLEYHEKQKIEYLFFLGDYVSDCPCPQKTLALLREAGTRFTTEFIRGNREEYMLDCRDGKHSDWRYGSKYGSLFYTYENLTKADLDWFGSLPITRRIMLPNAAPFDICHGTTHTSRFFVAPNTKTANEVLEGLETDTLLCAHSHEQFAYYHCGKAMINGGSVGVSKNTAGHAELAILDYDGKAWIPRLESVPYDLDGTVKEFYQSGFMESAKVWARCILKGITTGNMYTIACLDTVSRIHRETGLDDTSEEIWELAAKELGI